MDTHYVEGRLEGCLCCVLCGSAMIYVRSERWRAVNLHKCRAILSNRLHPMAAKIFLC